MSLVGKVIYGEMDIPGSADVIPCIRQGKQRYL